MRMVRMMTIAGALAGAGIQAAPLAAQSSWEGVIEFKGFRKDSSKMIQTSKGNLVRIDMMEAGKHGDKRGSVIFDAKTRTMTMIMYEQKMYMTTPMKSMDSMAASLREEHGPKDISFKDTGRTEVVAGTKCEIYHGTSTMADGKVEEGEACMAKGVGFNVMDFGRGGRGQSSDPTTKMFQKMAEKDLHMLKAWQMKDGKMEVMLEATKIEARSVSDAEMKPPADFKKFEMPTRPPTD